MISFPGRCVVVDAEPALSRSVRGSVRTSRRWRQPAQRDLPLCAQRLLAQEEQRARARRRCTQLRTTGWHISLN